MFFNKRLITQYNYFYLNLYFYCVVIFFCLFQLLFLFDLRFMLFLLFNGMCFYISFLIYLYWTGTLLDKKNIIFYSFFIFYVKLKELLIILLYTNVCLRRLRFLVKDFFLFFLERNIFYIYKYKFLDYLFLNKILKLIPLINI